MNSDDKTERISEQTVEYNQKSVRAKAEHF
jgi:hypothetical protein